MLPNPPTAEEYADVPSFQLGTVAQAEPGEMFLYQMLIWVRKGNQQEVVKELRRAASMLELAIAVQGEKDPRQLALFS